MLSTSRKFDPETNQVLFIAERLPEISDDWGLMLGDAFHNMRCALDHLWWQLAIDHLGREPTDEEAPEVQFPILTKVAPEKYSRHRYLKHVCGEAADKAEPLQGYGRPEGTEPLLAALADLSNHDKHRKIRPTFFISTGTSFTMAPSPDQLIDCKIPSAIDPADGKEVWSTTVSFGPDEPKVGDIVLGMEVVPTGPNPDIDMEPEITGDIALGEGTYTNALLDQVGNLIFSILNEFAPLLKPPD